MMNLILALAAIGTIYLLDALYDMTFKDNREPILRFVGFGLIALAVKIVVKFITWAITF